MLLSDSSLHERPLRYAAIVWSRICVLSTALASCSFTVVSRKESNAWSTEMGRLSVVPGLSIRVRPVVLRLCGNILMVRIMGIMRERALSQSGCILAMTFRVKPLYLAFVGICLMCSMRFGSSAEKVTFDTVLSFGLVGRK